MDLNSSLNQFFVKAVAIVAIFWVVIIVVKAVGFGAATTSWAVVLAYPLLVVLTLVGTAAFLHVSGLAIGIVAERFSKKK